MTATATKSSRKGSSKPASKKAAKSGKAKTKAVVAAPEVNPKEVFGSYKSGDYSAFCKKNHIRLNQTGITLPADESGDAFGKAVNKSNAAFAEASTRWEANEQYGRQHYNKYGFMHRDGLTRLNDEALALLMAQAGEELAQRAAFSGGAVENKKINPATALNHINGLSAWLKGRPAEIKGSRKAAAYELVKSDTGGKVLELTA
jgi:hypothetical protein